PHRIRGKLRHLSGLRRSIPVTVTGPARSRKYTAGLTITARMARTSFRRPSLYRPRSPATKADGRVKGIVNQNYVARKFHKVVFIIRHCKQGERLLHDDEVHPYVPGGVLLRGSLPAGTGSGI